MDLLDEWIFAAATSEPPPFITVAITNAVVLGKSNARLEAMNSTVRPMSHCARGFRRLDVVPTEVANAPCVGTTSSRFAMITLTCERSAVRRPT